MSAELTAELKDYDAVFANAATYRQQRRRESTENTIWEALSDIPHIRDLYKSFTAVAQNTLAGNIPEALFETPKLVLSGIGVGAAVPNTITILKERAEHRKEQKATLDLRKKYKETNDPEVIEQEERLELEGVQDTGVTSLSEQEYEDLQKSVDLSLYEQVKARLKNPSKAFLTAAAKYLCSYTYRTIKDSSTNFLRNDSRIDIFTGAYKGIRNTIKCRITEKDEIHTLANLKTISEKIAIAQEREEDKVAIQGRYLELATLDADLIKKLDGIREATRKKAKQLHTATTGVSLQMSFILASAGLCIWHTAHQDYVEAATQYASANLASNPLKFVGEQTQELYDAIHSHRVEEAAELEKVIARQAHLPTDEELEAKPEAETELEPEPGAE